MENFIQRSEARTQIGDTTPRYQQVPTQNSLLHISKGHAPSDEEHVEAVTLRSGKQLERVEEKPKRMAVDKGKEKVVEDEASTPPPPVKDFKPVLPYPARFKKTHDDEQFGKFLDLFKQLHINLPFVDALAQMPKYAKFLKDVLSNKRKLVELSTVTLNEECSAVLQNKIPRKLKDPGSFTIPCLIGDLSVDKALADLGASINLMPYRVFKRLGLGEPKPIRMSIQLADRSIKYPRGIIEDVLVKVDKFIFPVDFVILDMDEDTEVPLILGRPFLATARAIIDVSEGKLALRVGEEEVVFCVPSLMKKSLDSDDSCYSIDIIDHAVVDHL